MPFLNYLDDSQVESIHQATLRILSEVGILLTHVQAREMLSGWGATVKGERVLLPPDLVEICLARCPHQVSVTGRGGGVKTLGDGSLYFHNLGGARDLFDPVTGHHRAATLQDVRDATRLLDALEHCNTITPFFTPTDVPGPLMSLEMYRAAIPFTTKPLQGPGLQTAPEVRIALRMAEVLGDPTKMLTLSVSPVSPLKFPDHEVDAILEIARHGVPFGPLPCPTAGTTAPFAIAGAVAQQNAEVLAALVLAQLIQPGLPIIYCGRLAMMEPRSGISVWGGVELGLASAGTVQIGHRYGLPVNVYGFSTNSHILDEQNGFERALNAIIPAMAGADELSGIGEMEAGVSSSFAQMVIDNEHAASILRLRRGFTTDLESLAVDVVATAIQNNGNFMGTKHTVRRLKAGEVLLTKLAERGSWESWQQGGRKSLFERAQAEADRILLEHQVQPLEGAQEAELDQIMLAAERDLVPGGGV
jgi:trimethylamine--corrinoid protein Co-methyltransferase